MFNLSTYIHLVHLAHPLKIFINLFFITIKKIIKKKEGEALVHGGYTRAPPKN